MPLIATLATHRGRPAHLRIPEFRRRHRLERGGAAQRSARPAALAAPRLRRDGRPIRNSSPMRTSAGSTSRRRAGEELATIVSRTIATPAEALADAEEAHRYSMIARHPRSLPAQWRLTLLIDWHVHIHDIKDQVNPVTGRDRCPMTPENVLAAHKLAGPRPDR